MSAEGGENKIGRKRKRWAGKLANALRGISELKNNYFTGSVTRSVTGSKARVSYFDS